MGESVFGKKDNTAGFPVQTMDYVSLLAYVLGYDFHERNSFPRKAGGNHGKTSGFIHGDQTAILIEHL
jgi:hypothetical protein